MGKSNAGSGVERDRGAGSRAERVSPEVTRLRASVAALCTELLRHADGAWVEASAKLLLTAKRGWVRIDDASIDRLLSRFCEAAEASPPDATPRALHMVMECVPYLSSDVRTKHLRGLVDAAMQCALQEDTGGTFYGLIDLASANGAELLHGIVEQVSTMYES